MHNNHKLCVNCSKCPTTLKIQYNVLQETLRAQQLEIIQQANIMTNIITQQGEAIKNQAATIDEQGEVISKLEESLEINKRDCESEDMETGKV